MTSVMMNASYNYHKFAEIIDIIKPWTITYLDLSQYKDELWRGVFGARTSEFLIIANLAPIYKGLHW